MKKIGVVMTMLVGMVAIGCAKNPDSIVALNMPAHAYAGLSCQQLAMEHSRSSAALASVSQQQRQAAAGDAVGVFLIGVPVSSLSGGDKEGLVAQHKGEIIAIEGAMRNGHCPSALVSQAALPASSSPSVASYAGVPPAGPVRAGQ